MTPKGLHQVGEYAMPAEKIKYLVRTINARRGYTYYNDERQRFRVVTARLRCHLFECQDMYGEWFHCDPSSISVETT